MSLKSLLRAALPAAAIGSLLVSAAPAAAAPAEYDPHRVLVAFDSGVSADARSRAHAALGGRVVNTLAWRNLDVVDLPKGVDPKTAAARYEGIPAVAYAHPNWKVRLVSVPNDSLFGDLWGLHNLGQTGGTTDADIDAPEGWDTAFGSGTFLNSGGTRVGILDTGIDQAHPDLQNKTKACANAVTGTGIVVNGSCVDDNLHGTHVAGTIGALTNNSRGVAGVAPDSEFAVFKALNSAGTGFYADIIAGIQWLRDSRKGNARIISMSIGGPRSDALDKELTDAYAAGVLLIAAAGNDGDDTLNWPAAHRDVVSVAATDHKDQRASFSNANDDVEVAAPGVDVVSTVPGGTYLSLNGTSMATPHASGVAAMIMSEKGLNAADTRKLLGSSADDLGDTGRDQSFGWGRVNLSKALGGTSDGGGGGGGTTDPGAIAGKVTDARTGAALSSATVDCGSTAGSTTTGADGTYTLSSVPAGTYTCTAKKRHYRNASQSVTVTSGQTTTANFALQPR